MRLQDERVAAADRLIEADEDLAVGEVARGLRGDRDVELLGHLLGQFGVRAAREEHQILAVVGPLGAHCAPSLVGDRYGVIVRSLSACALPGYQIANGRRPVTRRRAAPRTDSRGLCGAASAAADPGRLRSTQPSMIALRARRHRQRAGRHIFAHHGARAGVGAVADRHRRDEHRVGSGPDVGADRGPALVLSVVVDEHARRADVAVLADVGVTDVGQVRHLRACADG